MLPARSRMRSSDEFAMTIKHGAKASHKTVSVYVRPAQPQSGAGRVGLIVSKKVGNAVARNRVKRILRHQMRELVEPQSGIEAVVVRAHPGAFLYQERLRSDLMSAFSRAKGAA